MRSDAAAVERGFAGMAKVKVKVVVGTLGEFKEPTRDPEEVAPELGIGLHYTGELSG